MVGAIYVPLRLAARRDSSRARRRRYAADRDFGFEFGERVYMKNSDFKNQETPQISWAIGIKYLFVAVLGITGAVTLLAAPQAGSDARARELIRLLNLKVLPKESGYLGIIGQSVQMVAVDGRTLAVQSQNYYMLTRE